MENAGSAYSVQNKDHVKIVHKSKRRGGIHLSDDEDDNTALETILSWEAEFNRYLEVEEFVEENETITDWWAVRLTLMQ